MITDKPTTNPREVRYYARAQNHKEALRNGSFMRRTIDGLALYILGDYVGDVETVPEGLTEFEKDYAESFLPACCK
jgi:hypothetical protein